MLLINCEIEFILIWSKNSAFADMTVRAEKNNNDPPVIVAPNRLEFQITHDIVCSSCQFVNRKWQKAFRTIKIRI